MWVKCWVMYPRLIEETRSLDHAIWVHQRDPGCLHVTTVTADVCLQNYVLKFSNYCFIKFIVNLRKSHNVWDVLKMRLPVSFGAG